jgi:hypothetical protein
MKKLIGILGIVMITAMLLFNTNNIDVSIQSVDLAALIEMNSANAEDNTGTNCNCTFWGKCKASGSGAHCAGFPGNGDCQTYNGNC